MDIKIVASLESAVLFLIISSPFVYTLTQKVFGKAFTVANNGCPTKAGLILHAVVFGLIVYALMHVNTKYKNEYLSENSNYNSIIDPLFRPNINSSFLNSFSLSRK